MGPAICRWTPSLQIQPDEPDNEKAAAQHPHGKSNHSQAPFSRESVPVVRKYYPGSISS